MLIFESNSYLVKMDSVTFASGSKTKINEPEAFRDSDLTAINHN